MDTRKKIARSTFAIIILSLVGKIFGFLRESLTAYVFGTSIEMDAFSLAQAAVPMIGGLIVQAIATTYIPSMQKAELEHGSDRKNYFTNNLFTIISILSIVIILLGILFPKPVALLSASQKSPETFALCVELVKYGMPVIIFSAWQGILTGYLQYHGKFAAVGAIAIPLNVVYIVYLLLASRHGGAVGLTVAMVLGTVAQFLFLLPGALKLGFRPGLVFDLQDKYMREATILSLPVLVSTSITNINVMVNRKLASGMGIGNSSVLYFSNKMNTMFFGIFITAVTAVVFPILTKTFSENNIKQGKRIMNASIKTVLFLTVPAMVGLLILARPIIEIAFVRGNFSEQSGLLATSTLRCYCLSLVSLSILSVVNRVFYAIQDTRTPFVIGVVNVALNVGLNLLVARHYGVNALALSVSIATTTAALISFYLLKVRLGNLGTKSYIKALIKTIMASVAMAAVTLIYFPFENLIHLFLHSDKWYTIGRLILLMGVVGIAAAVYGICLYYLGVREIRDLAEIMKKKLKERRLSQA